jgi:tRNA nucleotidyltransferase/poly(A) polymerase
MPDYMFLIESRLSPEQRAALHRVQELTQAGGMNVYLTGGAVRDLISGMPIRDLDFTVQGNPAGLARKFEKEGVRIVEENEQLRHVEMLFPGEVDVSLAAARDDVYERPGAKPELRWATIIEDLKRRDFSMNAVGISLNVASRGLLLDPTNGLADLEKREIRVLTMHAFTNQPIRLLRIVRFAARTGCRMETRTAEWLALAMERRLHESLAGEDVGYEVRQLAREAHPVAVLKAWASHGLLGAIHPRLPKRLADYDSLNRLVRVRGTMEAAGTLPRLLAPVTHYVLVRLKSRERGSALSRMEYRAAQAQAVLGLEKDVAKVVKMLKGRKTAAPRDAYDYLEHVPPDLLAFMQVEVSNSKVLGKVRNYLFKWKPLRRHLPADELAALGVPRGPKFDKVLEDFFQLQLMGKARNPQDRVRILRQLAGIKPEPKKKAKELKRAVKAAEEKKKARAKTGAPQAGGPPVAPAPPGAAKPAEALGEKRVGPPAAQSREPAKKAAKPKTAKRQPKSAPRKRSSAKSKRKSSKKKRR